MVTELHLQLVAGLLRRGKALDQLSSALTLLGLLAALAPLLGFVTLSGTYPLALALVLCGLLEKYFALRVALDAELFQLLATEPLQLAQHTQDLDRALIELGLSKAIAERSWQQRSAAALGLLRRQALYLALQLLLALTASLLLPWFSPFEIG